MSGLFTNYHTSFICQAGEGFLILTKQYLDDWRPLKFQVNIKQVSPSIKLDTDDKKILSMNLKSRKVGKPIWRLFS